MPSALEKLVKILKLEQNTGCQNKAVIGGLAGFGTQWAVEAHSQAKKPEHHLLVDELAGLLVGYDAQPEASERSASIKYMLVRITGRIPPTAPALPPSTGSPQLAFDTSALPARPPEPDRSVGSDGEGKNNFRKSERSPVTRAPVPRRPPSERPAKPPHHQPEETQPRHLPESHPPENTALRPENSFPERRPAADERPTR